MTFLRLLAVALLPVLAGGCASQLGSLRVPALPDDAVTHPEDFVVVTVRNDVAGIASHAGSTPRGYDTVSAYAVSSKALSLISGIAHDYELHEIAGWPIVSLRVHCVVFRRPENVERGDLLARLARDPRVALAQPLNTFSTSTDTSFNDPYARLQTNLDALGVAEAHRWSVGEGVRVAVIDTGVNSAHPDLDGRVIVRRNFVDRDLERFEHDLHGTQVAGVIAAIANNGQGIVGIAPRAKILALKACWQSVAGGAQCNSFTLAQALVAATDAHADIVNLSLTGPADPLLSELVKRGLARGSIYVGSVPPGGRRDGFPVGIEGVIAADSSTPIARPRSVLYAPGRNVLTLAPDGHYDFASGSSLAAAHVSGALALLLARQPHLAAAALDQLLSRTTAPIASDAGPIESINVCGALAAMLSRPSCAALAASTDLRDPALKRSVAARDR